MGTVVEETWHIDEKRIGVILSASMMREGGMEKAILGSTCLSNATLQRRVGTISDRVNGDTKDVGTILRPASGIGLTLSRPRGSKSLILRVLSGQPYGVPNRSPGR